LVDDITVADSDLEEGEERLAGEVYEERCDEELDTEDTVDLFDEAESGVEGFEVFVLFVV
jgi:hypothetical protein